MFEGNVMQMMCSILLGLGTTLGALLMSLSPAKTSKGTTSTWLACPKQNPAKRAWEVFNLQYAVVWVGCFVCIVAFGLYESWDELRYFAVLSGLCGPIIIFPLWKVHPSEAKLPLGQRFAVRANVWIAVYSFIGNYWYTHYFYNVLGAQYTFPSWRLNDVPIPLYFATFFYFCMYHALSNMAIRKVVTTFEPSGLRAVTLIVLIGAMAYTTAFMETLTISGFPYYTFVDRNMAYVVGSAFYGIYFIVSFPMFYAFDEGPQKNEGRSRGSSLEGVWSAAVNSMGGGMLILTLLDFVRILVGTELLIKA